jgi:cell division protein FtsW (lipid II flippase)
MKTWTMDDATLVLTVLGLSLFGVAMIYSAGVLNEPSTVTENIWQKQLGWLIVGRVGLLRGVPDPPPLV